LARIFLASKRTKSRDLVSLPEKSILTSDSMRKGGKEDIRIWFSKKISISKWGKK
jgi:hypothetical protein